MQEASERLEQVREKVVDSIRFETHKRARRDGDHLFWPIITILATPVVIFGLMIMVAALNR